MITAPSQTKVPPPLTNLYSTETPADSSRSCIVSNETSPVLTAPIFVLLQKSLFVILSEKAKMQSFQEGINQHYITSFK